jgi:hypothetical protein
MSWGECKAECWTLNLEGPPMSEDIAWVVNNRNARTFVCFFFFLGFCFLCQLNCPDLLFFFFFWVLFSVSVKLPGPFFLFVFFLGFCFLCRLNCPDLFSFLFWVFFSVSVKLPRPFFFLFLWILFSVSVKLPGPFFFFFARRVHYAPGSH